MLDESIFAHFPVLDTQRLRLRQIVSADTLDLFAIFSDPEVCRYYDLDPLVSVTEAEEMVQRFANRFDNNISFRWGITLKPDDTVIGTCGLFIHSNWRGAIGYDLAQTHWGQGIMTEAVGAVTRFGFEQANLTRIEAFVMLDNIASVKLLTKLGYTEEGILRRYMHFKGQLHDMRCFSYLNFEYARRSG